ncbi:type II toxin-antitoxin system RelE/ParE family toxin [Candidatus Nephthysia bennettiae]|uniref:Type II toxin-antitoxin system RelE/ParE family toxin n=1 Tax=Candidatus Nephthysia bennettiae TaxID=3127016 RepID=A0A934KER4_9BACT|nr:type II toxin-antitoxin system RelE/ParE family toxin [Candidatus Dormibacteraeota bacterium]MBJ7612597.1 type II toxin-antitoxin system RelE/ParE family toxin [Candidatus Dormibacteraeota bacterium]
MYSTATGSEPVKEFLDQLSAVDHAVVIAGMREVQRDGLVAARHIAGDIYEVRATRMNRHFRILFALEGKRILLALDAYNKDTPKMPLAILRRAERRLRDWRSRGHR